MKKTSRRYTKIGYAVVLALAIGHGQLAQAGWSGAMNGTGNGTASVNVRAFETSGGKTKYATTQITDLPSASIPKDILNYKANNDLPVDASRATVAKVAGFAGYIWQANVVGSDGDDTGNDELDHRITITATDCASLTMQSSSEIDTTKKTGTLTINVTGTAGTAIWMRGYELKDPAFQTPDPDNELTEDVNEFVEYLKLHGTLKWDVVNVGPMDQQTATCNALKIPFSYETFLTNLYAVSDGIAKSLPLVITCPVDKTITCGESYSYPAVSYAGCGNITVTFNPSTPDFHLGSNPVTVTVTDQAGNTKSCTFNVTVTDTTKPVVTLLGDASMTVECHGTFTDPGATANDTCAGSRTVTVSGSVNADSVGDYTLTYSATDPSSNTGTATRTVHVVDTTKPVISATGTPMNGVLGASPTAEQINAALGTATASDTCQGALTPTFTTSSVSVNGCTSSQTRTWNVTDAAGNAATPVSRTVTWGGGPLTLRGFFSPIGTQANDCGTTTVTVNKGNVIPIKFDVLCGTSPVTTGILPTVKIQEYPDCNTPGTFVTSPAVYQNDWHGNWDTNPTKKNYKYRISVIVNEAEIGFVWVKVK